MNATNASWKVVVTARAFWTSGQAANELLAKAGCVVHNTPKAGPLALGMLIDQCRDADAVIASSDPYHAGLYVACPNIKVVARCGVGIDSVNLKDSTEAGILVTNTPGAMTEAVADYCFALLLGLVRRIPEGAACMASGGWTEYPGIELPGKTIGMVGFGMIGQAVMRRSRGFGMKMLAFDPPLVKSGRAADFPDVEFVDLDRLFSESHVVSIHAPNMPETRHMVNAHRLSQMRSDAYLINTSRGALIDEAALMQALNAGKIAGAAIDVFEKEPLPADSPLRKTPRLLLTPHNAFNSVEAAERMSLMSAESVVDALQGRKPRFLCNPEVLGSSHLRCKVS